MRLTGLSYVREDPYEWNSLGVKPKYVIQPQTYGVGQQDGQPECKQWPGGLAPTINKYGPAMVSIIVDHYNNASNPRWSRYTKGKRPLDKDTWPNGYAGV